MRTDVYGVGFDNITMDEAVEKALELMQLGQSKYVVTPNPEIVWLCRTDDKLKSTINEAHMVLADGIGIIYGAKILGRPLKQKLPGIDFAMELMGRMAQKEMSVFLFGAKPGVAEEAGEKLKADFPGLVIAGTADGYFKDSAPIIESINKLKPDLTLVCLGACKQEEFMSENSGKINTGLMAGLGGTLDVLAGNVKRAPEGWQKLGLEWLYRLFKEPRRIGRMLKLPLFLAAVIGQRLGGQNDAC